jgi:lipoprotein-anchoring transpeptidase ErfK/SrfK
MPTPTPTPTPSPTPTRRPPTATPVPPPAPAHEDRWIDIDLTRQVLTAYEGSVPVRVVVVSTGLPQTPTPTGQFRIWAKLRYDDMYGPNYYLPDVPYVMYFYGGYGLHGTYWHNNFGRPMSHGCVNLPTSEAEWLFNWAEVGTLVTIHY